MRMGVLFVVCWRAGGYSTVPGRVCTWRDRPAQQGGRARTEEHQACPGDGNRRKSKKYVVLLDRRPARLCGMRQLCLCYTFAVRGGERDNSE
jgi:hypothetical protein